MTTQVPALCLSCTRREPTSDPGTGTPTVVRCKAFPGGIPFEIAIGGDHRLPHGGEVDGLVYEQAEGEQARQDFDAWQRFHAA